MRGEILELLNNDLMRRIFYAIARKRRISMGDLLRTIDTPPEQAQKILERLKGIHLIEESSAPLREWNTYFVTADGLSAERALERLDVK